MITEIDAERLMREAEAAFGAADVDRVLALFTPDVVVRYADQPEIRGRDEYAAHLRTRFARQCGYQPVKRLRAIAGDVLVDSWEGAWEDGETGMRMRCRGMEVLTLREGRVAELDAVVTAWEEER